MSIENFIRDALYKPNDYIAYHVGRKLAELHPEKTILEGQNLVFRPGRLRARRAMLGDRA